MVVRCEQDAQRSPYRCFFAFVQVLHRVRTQTLSEPNLSLKNCCAPAVTVNSLPHSLQVAWKSTKPESGRAATFLACPAAGTLPPPLPPPLPLSPFGVPHLKHAVFDAKTLAPQLRHGQSPGLVVPPGAPHLKQVEREPNTLAPHVSHVQSPACLPPPLSPDLEGFFSFFWLRSLFWLRLASASCRASFSALFAAAAASLSASACSRAWRNAAVAAARESWDPLSSPAFLRASLRAFLLSFCCRAAASASALRFFVLASSIDRGGWARATEFFVRTPKPRTAPIGSRDKGVPGGCNPIGLNILNTDSHKLAHRAPLGNVPGSPLDAASWACPYLGPFLFGRPSASLRDVARCQRNLPHGPCGDLLVPAMRAVGPAAAQAYCTVPCIPGPPCSCGRRACQRAHSQRGRRWRSRMRKSHRELTLIMSPRRLHILTHGRMRTPTGAFMTKTSESHEDGP